MNYNTIDQTGYGYSSGGFAPTSDDSLAARRNKAEMDRMSDFMQKFDPTINRSVETMIRSQVRNGATPEEARRAAFGSTQGQIMSDVMLGLRRTGFLGQGDPINTGRNFLQGVSGGGFSMNVLGPGGRSAGMNQSVMGGGLLSGTASTQMARDVMTNLYGAGGSDPKSASGFNMEESSGVFRKLAERGALGNIGTLKNYSEDSSSADYKGGARAVNEKLENARRQEIDPLIQDALKGTNAENIDDKIAEAIKKGDVQIAKALGEIKTGSSTFALNDENTKRVSDVTKETLKGLANLKDIYGELNSTQLLAQMEAITGIRITNSAESKRANNMVQNITNTATATGNDPRGVMQMMMAQQAGYQEKVAATFGEDLGAGGAQAGLGKEIAQKVNEAVTNSALTLEAGQRDDASVIGKQMGIDLKPVSKEDMLADTQTQTFKWMNQNKAAVMASGLASSTQKGNAEFTTKERELQDKLRSARTPDERDAANAALDDLVRTVTDGVGAEEYGLTAQGKAANKEADMGAMIESAGVNSSRAVRNLATTGIMKKVGLAGEDLKSADSGFKNMGIKGMAKLADDKGKIKSAEERQKEYAIMIENGVLTEAEAAAVEKNMLGVSEAQYKAQTKDVGSSSAQGRSLYDVQIGNAERDSRVNKQQRSAFSDEKGLSLKSIANAILTDPEKKGLDTDTKRLFALEAMQKAGLAGDLAPATKVDTRDGYGADEMEAIRKASGDKNFNIHTEAGFNSEAEMIEASTKGPKKDIVNRRIKRILDKDTRLLSGGTEDEMSYANAGQDEKIKERAKNFELASKFGQLQGVEMTDDASSWTPAMKEIMETGKVSKGGIGIEMEVDSKKNGVYDNDGDSSEGWFNMNWNDEAANPEDKVMLKNAAKFDKLASRFNSKEEGADMLKMDGFNNNEMRNDMEAQLEVLKDRQKAGAKIIYTGDTNADGSKEKLDMGAAIKNLTEAIAKAKADDGKGQPVQEMRVTTLVVERQENK
jgi:hypothetical protein